MILRLSILFSLMLSPPVTHRTSCRELPGVLLITVDALRPDHLGCMGYGRDTSPNLDRIASEGILFTQAISSSSWTTPGLISALTGLYAPTHGVDARDKSLRPGLPTLPRVLRPLGYVSPDVCYLTTIPNFTNLGFVPYPPRDSLIANGDEILFKCLEDHRDRRFFIYYHYRNLHLPYDPGAPYDRMFMPEGFQLSAVPVEKLNAVTKDVMIPSGHVRFGDSDREWVNGLYDGQIREMDERFFGRLEETLGRLGLRERVLLVITADHGEELLDHGLVGHASTSLSGTAYDEVIRIPLIIRYPATLKAGLAVNEQVQVIDVLPTILDMLGGRAPEGVQGQSLVPLIQGRPGWQARPAFCETTPGGYQAPPEMLKIRVRSMRTQGWKFIRTSGPSLEREELYHLDEDPGERRNQVEDHQDVARQMRAELDRWTQESGQASRGRRVKGPGGPAEKDSAETAAQGGLGPAEPVRILFPEQGDTLRHFRTGGKISPRWTGDSNAVYTAEYRVGEGTHHFLEGQISVQGNAPKYGPFGHEMWNTLVLYNPWRFRVRRADGSTGWSDWSTFCLAPVSAEHPSGPLVSNSLFARLPGLWQAALTSTAWRFLLGIGALAAVLGICVLFRKGRPG